MTSRDWRAWLVYMKDRKGWTKKRCCEALGCGLNQGYKWGKSDPPFYIGLACRALANDLSPWDGRHHG